MNEVTKENWSETIADGVTLVDVWGPSCQPCIAMMPDVQKLADERTEDMKVVKLEAPKNRRLCMEYKIMGLPAFLLFRDGEEVDRLTSADVTAGELRKWVDGHLAALSAKGGE